MFEVIDNAIDETSADVIAANLMGPHFPWYANSSVIRGEELLHSFQFVHQFYNDGQIKSDYLPLLQPLINRLDALCLVRIKANLLTWTAELTEHGFHVDYSDPRITTAVYYVNTNNGYTRFNDDRRVDSVHNRLAIFNAPTPHTGSTATDTQFRCVINFNYVANSVPTDPAQPGAHPT